MSSAIVFGYRFRVNLVNRVLKEGKLVIDELGK